MTAGVEVTELIWQLINIAVVNLDSTSEPLARPPEAVADLVHDRPTLFTDSGEI
jgi:hypothetical protein